MPDLKYATLSLNKRTDADAWEKGCKELGLKQAFSCNKEDTTPADIMQFLGAEADWIYLAGHSTGKDLYGGRNSLGPDGGKKPFATFAADGITIYEHRNGPLKKKIPVGDHSFKLRKVKLVVFGACAPFWPTGGCAPDVQTLFGGAAVLGTSGLTGPKMIMTMFAGLGSARGFFGNCQGNGMDPVKAWLTTAVAIYGGSPPIPPNDSIEENFRALDVFGQHWKIEKKRVVRAEPIQ